MKKLEVTFINPSSGIYGIPNVEIEVKNEHYNALKEYTDGEDRIKVYSILRWLSQKGYTVDIKSFEGQYRAEVRSTFDFHPRLTGKVEKYESAQLDGVLCAMQFIIDDQEEKVRRAASEARKKSHPYDYDEDKYPYYKEDRDSAFGNW